MIPRLRPARMADVNGLYFLFQAVAQEPGGLSRSMEEASEGYVRRCLEAAGQRGLALLAEGDGFRGAVWAWRPEPASLRHTLSDLTLAVHPDARGNGLGRALLQALLDEVKAKHPGILRIELVVRESNAPALGLFSSLGFVREGRFLRRILSTKGAPEADIPMAWFNPSFRP